QKTWARRNRAWPFVFLYPAACVTIVRDGEGPVPIAELLARLRRRPRCRGELKSAWPTGEVRQHVLLEQPDRLLMHSPRVVRPVVAAPEEVSVVLRLVRLPVHRQRRVHPALGNDLLPLPFAPIEQHLRERGEIARAQAKATARHHFARGGRRPLPAGDAQRLE